MNCKFFSCRESEMLRAVFLKCISSVCAYTLEYNGGLKFCVFIHILFEGDKSLVITTGSFADNIILIDEADFDSEKEKYSLQDGVKMKANVMSDIHKIVGKKLHDVECVQKPNEEYYWQLIFNFQKSALNINALVDELEITISP